MSTVNQVQPEAKSTAKAKPKAKARPKRTSRTSRPSSRLQDDSFSDMPPPRKIKGLHKSNIQFSDMLRCYEILEEIMNTQDARNWFNIPFDYEALWPHYPSVISSHRPMDLGSIKTMLLMNRLGNPDHFADHVRVVFQNAMEFNQVGTSAHTAATNLMAMFTTKYDQFLQQEYGSAALLRRANEQESNSDASMDSEQVKNFKEKLAYLMSIKRDISITRRSIDGYKKGRAKMSKLENITLSEPIKPKPFTYEEKVALVQKMTELDVDALRGLLLIIHPDGNASGEIEIDFLELDDDTLYRVQTYVDSYMRPNHPPPPAIEPPAKKRRRKMNDSATKGRREKLAAARQVTEKRLAETKKQINVVNTLQHLQVGQLQVGKDVIVNPAEPGEEKFWIAQIVDLVSDQTVKIQWYELKNREAISQLDAGTGGNVRMYAKTTTFDTIAADSIIPGVFIQLQYSEATQYYSLNDVKGILSQLSYP